ncbi:enoyl-CoA delta isomerase 1, mitochondrial-like [Glandiceps talaboti]
MAVSALAKLFSSSRVLGSRTGLQSFQHVRTSIQKRCLSSTSSMVEIERDPSNQEIVVLKMINRPVNIIDNEFINVVTNSIKDIEADESCRGLIIASDCPKVFSAGLDLSYMYQASHQDIKEYFAEFQKLCKTVFNSRLLTLAAINGHAPAGGCVLTLGCEYRIMAEENCNIGLNEVPLNLALPSWICSFLTYILGPLTAERVILTGRLFKPQEALNIGMIDQVVPPDELMLKSVNLVNQCLKVPDFSRRLTKERLRKDTLDAFTSQEDICATLFADNVVRDDFQKALGETLERMKKK